MVRQGGRWLAAAVAATVLLGPVLAEGMAALPRPPHRMADRKPLSFPLAGLPPIRGFCLSLDYPGRVDAYLKALERLRRMGCPWVNVVVNARQRDIHARHLAMNWKDSPRPSAILRILRQAHRLGLHTMLMPIVLLNHATGDQWRGAIQPPNWAIWFGDYRRYLLRCARWANRGHVSIFSVGSELLSTEKFRTQWLRVIRMVRRAYHGKLTYSANWDHYQHVRIWPQLDYIGMNAYYDLGAAKTPVRRIVATWRHIQRRIFALAQREHKPVLLTEIGWDNLHNTLEKPWDYVGEGKIDPAVQLRAYTAFVTAWRHLPSRLFLGAFFWQWQPGAKATDYGSYSLQGEPALPLVEHWMSGR